MKTDDIEQNLYMKINKMTIGEVNNAFW